MLSFLIGRKLEAVPGHDGATGLGELLAHAWDTVIAGKNTGLPLGRMDWEPNSVFICLCGHR